VPAGTSTSLFRSATIPGKHTKNENWSFKVGKGAHVQVRLYFAKPPTKSLRKATFGIYLDGKRKTKAFNISKAAGTRGFAKKYDITSDGRVDVALRSVRGLPALSGIEIVRSGSVPAPISGEIVKHSASSASSFGGVEAVDGSATDWSQVTGAFQLGGQLYVGHANGSFTRQTFNDGHLGAPTSVNDYDALSTLTAWHNEVGSMRGMFYNHGRIYYVVNGSSKLFYRYFEPQSGLVGSQQFVAQSSKGKLNFGKLHGMFVAHGYFYRTDSAGSLWRSKWHTGDTHGSASAKAKEIAGPGVDTRSWLGGVTFLVD
jgi:hypothetical protein